MSERRAYDNSRRAAQADRTVERILDATIALFGTRREDVSVAAIAQKAGVSAPTVYKYFPNRAAIYEAVQNRIDERFGRPTAPNSLTELRNTIPRLHRFFSEQEDLVRAVVTTPQLRPFWEVVRKRREDATRRAMHVVLRHLPEDEATAIRAIAVRLIGIEGWLEMKDRWHLADETITAATLRAFDALVADLARSSISLALHGEQCQ